ncbi:MAG: ABC transporter ATP-binding protein [Henriciella sp.]|jgi:ABC-2 type transport system ATP-binding protein|uniref:ABC transporter ATP-binding protein n=1 Tax=Henriciella sp. TaxID=1968823 RepID=UPI000C0E1073|nr:ATP-binding cassette domain-containing protein [Henriciella sp.]MAN73274.1 ABC transporter ATP-binding protein [Henriciella sp.]MBF33357.1 ABC transporter ATP-binding protein [Hyphomonadaceae bacterium]PHR79056.1 MAG: ABC transporter ATP-binding protein [Henriciella sp.]|tara:strand:+ start:293 stop:1255 length:963 start_codon:yes stop_codon:yes gene_type:complete
MASAPLELSHVTKRFGAFTAVRDLSLTVPQGSIVGFLGPNGAGKSTSLRMALGVLGPDEGQVNLFGAPPNIDTLRHVGFLPEERGLYKKMSPRAIISYFARLKGMSAGESRKRADELLERMGLSEFARVRVSKLSKGMSQKVQILASLAHQPDFLILDEPFSGLDPVNQQGLEDMIIEEHRRGATILFSTHVMEHAERLCDSIVMMARGRKVFDGTLDEAFGALGRAVLIGVSEGFDLDAALRPHGFETNEKAGDTWRVRLPSGKDAQDALRAAIDAGAPITSFRPEDAKLRDVFVSLVSEAEAEDLRQTLAGSAARKAA